MVDPFTVRPPAHLVSTAGVSNHLGSAAWYRLVVRNLFAVAQVTNRIPILPKLICPCDRYWGDVLPGCQIGGADVPPPYDFCPQDHVTNLPNMERAGLVWRPYGFLESEGVKQKNPGLLGKAQRVYVEFGEEGDGGENTDEDATNTDTNDGAPSSSSASDKESSANRVVRVPLFPADVELISVVGDAREHLAVLGAGVGSFCGFVDQGDAESFDAQMQIGLEAESHFCGPKPGGAGRACDVGFDTPKNTGRDNDCAAMRLTRNDPDGFRERYARIGRHQDS